MSKRRPSSSASATSVSRWSLVEPREHGVGGVRLGLVGEVDARHDVLEQPAREDDDLEVRRLQAAVRPRHAAGLDGDELEAAAVDRARAAEAVNPSSSGSSSRCRRVRVAPGGVRLPDLDHPVGHGLAGAVEQDARGSGSPAGRPGRRGVGPIGPPSRPMLEVRPDGLRRRERRRSVIVRLLERRRLAAAEHDVEAVAERPVGLGQPEVERG